jgi:DNA repair exonuclease SbcCD ATPase subunit
MIKTIAHLADIHIRKLWRFIEYREVFSRLYEKLKQLKPDLIFVGGDIVHGKLDTSPEETRLVADFFLRLSDISELIVIPGNHDVNLNNKSREDTLSPIIDLVKQINSNVHYWKQSGQYTIQNVDFGVMSIFDRDKNGNQIVHNLPNPGDLDNEHTIAVFHGGVGTFEVDTGLQMTDKNVSTKTFKGYNIVMLGDIHKRQFLNVDKTIGYPGSLIQQNFAEDTSKGFLLWDLDTRKSTFHQVENDYGFKTINVINGKIENKMKFIPPKGNIKIKYRDSSLEEIKNIQLILRKKYPKLKEIKTEKQDAFSINKGSRIHKIDIGDVRDISYQNKLISEFLSKQIDNIDEKTISRICKINELTNNSPEIYDGDITRNVDWKIKSFEFDNMFSYGEENKIDFEKLNGLIGVVAPNHSGKSSLLDAVSYTIYDTCSRAWKAIEILNKRKNRFKAKLNLEINGESYWIERVGELKSRKNRKTKKITYFCPVNVKFYMEDGDEIIDLTGAARRTTQYGSGTNEEIRKILGTFDDFILTSLSLQTNGVNFIDKKQSERKQILSQFMDIEIFDQLYDLAKDDSNEERILLKTFQKKDSYSELATIEQKILDEENNEKDILTKKSIFENKIQELSDNKLNLTKQLYKIDETIDISELTALLDSKNKEKNKVGNDLSEDIEYKENLRPLYLEYHKKLSKLDEDKIQNDYEEYKLILNKKSSAESKLGMLQTNIKSIKSHLEDLDKYKYDPNCEFCINNGKEQIKNKTDLIKKLKNSKEKYDIILVDYEQTESDLEKIEYAEELKEEYARLNNDLNQIQHDAVTIGGKISTKEEKLNSLSNSIETINEKIKQYYKIEEKIKNNKKINLEIVDVNEEFIFLEEQFNKNENKYKDILSNLSVLRNRKTQLEKDIQNLIDIEQKILDYDLYLMSISRDGIPYELISKTIPIIEKEVNDILDNMMVGFTIKMEMEGKNIDTYICYGDDQWNLELSSGMERFVSSLAIRIGLINVSTLPRPNFLVIDEGFGTLDGDNIANMGRAFSYLKTQFDFVMIITHLDVIKDYMDILLPINIDNDKFSNIIYK